MRSFFHRISQRIRTAAREKIHAFRCAIEYLRERLGGFFGVLPTEETLVYTSREESMIEQGADAVCRFFPQQPGKCLLAEDIESRCEAVEDLAEMLTEVFQLENVRVSITDSEEIFPEGSSKTYGLTDVESGCIYINYTCLCLDDATVLDLTVSALIHELRHIMQYQVMTLKNVHDIPYNRRCIWRHNYRNYIRYTEDPEGYSCQPLEADARNFTNRIWRRVYRREIS